MTDREQFQEQLDSMTNGNTFVLFAQKERSGPVVIRNNITVEGNGSTVWANVGNVIRVTAKQAVLKNFRIEFTGSEAGVALVADHPGLVLENVTVRGNVIGLTTEAGEWRYPHQLNLGTVFPGVPHEVRMRIVVPVPCQLSSDICGVTLHPQMLVPGAHEIRIVIDPLKADTLVCGALTIRTAFLRREIVLNARALAPVAGLSPPLTEQERIVWQPHDWAAISAPSKAKTPAPAKPPPGPVVVPPRIVPPRPVVVSPPPVVPPPMPLNKPRLRSVSGPLLGGAFSSPLIVPTPVATEEPPPAVVPAPVMSPELPKFKPIVTVPKWAQPPKPPEPAP